MRIPALVYIVLGILMALYARFIQSRVDKGSLVIFFWIGIIFIGYGFFRLVLNFVLRDKSSVKKKNNSELDALKREKERLLKNQSMNQNKEYESESREIVSCARCGTRHYSNSNFCHMCGYSLK